MAEPIAVLTSDLHLDDYAWADRPDLRGDSQDAFRQIVDYAIDENLPIIAAGDLIDKKRNDAAPIGFLRKQLDRLQAEGVPLFHVQGQHEFQAKPWLNEIHEWPVWLADRSDPASGLAYEIGVGEYAYGIDWTPRDRLADELAKVPEGTSILVMHQVMGDLMGSICTPELNADMLPDVPILLIGDYHKHVQLVRRNAHGTETTILSPGSTNMREISEPASKQFYLLHDDLSYASVLLRTRRFVYKEINLPEDLDNFVETIGHELEGVIAQGLRDGLSLSLARPFLRVGYDPSVPDVYSRVSVAVGDELAHLFFRELPQKQFDDAAEETAEEREEFREAFAARGLAGLLPRVLDPLADPQAYAIAERLLESTTPAQALQEIRAEFFGDVAPKSPVSDA
jgi:hypothetical protein